MFFSKLFSGATSYAKEVVLITQKEQEIQGLSDEDFFSRVRAFKNQHYHTGIKGGDDALYEAFTLVREAAKRTLGQRHYDEQLEGGLAMYYGAIAEMRTGEGKTLAVTAPVYAHALAGKGVHMITVNDYLAQRDAAWMGQIYYALGLSVSCIVHDNALLYDPSYTQEDAEQSSLDEARDEQGGFKVFHEFLRPVSRQEAYQADITYGTNHEFGFDYLRDNLAQSTAQQVQRGQAVVFIDEIDSVLIDEARTPMIISAPNAQAAEFYKLFAGVVRNLSPDTHYEVDEKARYVHLTEEGIEQVEKILSLDNLYDPQHMQLVHYLDESLKAKALFVKDRHYVVKNGGVIIVDEFTGRLMPGRRYSGGLHQALEAKEGLVIQEESKTFAQITIQNYFRLYEHIAGMTGTAKTSQEEFLKVYGLDVIVIPTHKPMIRLDRPDSIYKTKEIKYEAIVQEVKERNEKGQPVLIGTTSIDENELLSDKLSRAGVSHEVLNAKQHEREGEIIAQAGKKGSVTLATNLAGRGVDIMLGGAPHQEDCYQEVTALGGLFVLGTQRNDARRIDNQLRGRAGRQGDPGETKFILSLEDDLLRIFGGERIGKLMERVHLPDQTPIESSIIGKVVEEAQKKVEGLNFDIRKHLLEYDDVLNTQRATIYKRRQSLLRRIEGGELEQVLSDITLSSLQRGFEHTYRSAQAEGVHEGVLTSFIEGVKGVGIIDSVDELGEEQVSSITNGELPDLITQKITAIAQHEGVGRRVIGALDMFWANHLEQAEALLESVRLRAYGQKDPLVEYKRESYDLFKNLIAGAEDWIVANVFATSRMKADSKAQIHADKGVAIHDHVGPRTNSQKYSKVGRNDPCPCGSGKKYKRCHGA
jgi:preprotein translocase subunit SecA